jgi:hypothetical protein
MLNPDKRAREVVVVFALGFLVVTLNLVVGGAIIYAAWHFISKFW